MSERDDGGSAFPRIQQIDKFENIVVDHEPGISVRDYFAAKAMAAHITRHPVDVGGTDYPFDDTMAEWAYAQADAMLKARSA